MTAEEINEINKINEMVSPWPGWEADSEIGHGAYGRVYRIKRSSAGFGEFEYQALKIISIPLDEDQMDFFLMDEDEREKKNIYYKSMADKLAGEATFMRDLEGCPYVVRYYDHLILPHGDGKLGWDILIRMELLTPFRQYIAEHGFTRQEIIQLGIDVCIALEFCKKHKVIHRDIKPENIFISDKGNYKLGDFGVAVNADRTLGGLSKKGTYEYMAPEVYGNRPYGATIDIYSLGIILYRLLNDNIGPFMPAKGADVTFEDSELALAKRMKCEPFPLPANDTGSLARIVLKAAAPYPEDRYNSPVDMRFALSELLDEMDSKVMLLPVKTFNSYYSSKKSSGKEPISLSVNPSEPEEELTDGSKKQSTRIPTFVILSGALIILAVVCYFIFRTPPEPDGVSIIVPEEYIEDGSLCELSCEFTPKEAESSVKWYSSNDIIATVDENGVLSAHTAGVVTITAELENGVINTCNVVVKSNYTTVYVDTDYSDVYDYNYYIATYPEVKEECGDAPELVIQHFINIGISSGYQGIADFNVLGYAFANADLRAQYGNDMYGYVMHYISTGKSEGRSGLGPAEMVDYRTEYDGVDYSAVYDYNYYIKACPEAYTNYGVDDQGVLEYFVTVGMPQGQQGCEAFNPISYAFAYADVRERYHHELNYYIEQGGYDYTELYYDYINIGRDAGYTGIGFDKMQNAGTVYDGTDYSGEYDYNAYCENNKDIFALAGVDDEAVLEHYVLYGREEGRIAQNS